MLKRIRDDVRDRIAEHNLQSQLDISVGSIINALLFGYRFEGVSCSGIRIFVRSDWRSFSS